MSRLGMLGASAAALVLYAFGACSDNTSSDVAATTSASSAKSTTTGSTYNAMSAAASSGSGGKAPCAPAAIPKAVPAGWIEFSDGWSWVIPNTKNQQLLTPIGIDCQDVFIMGSVGDKISQMARVRLDSLGPGMAPD